MTKGEVPVRDMGRVGKELGRLEAVLEKRAKVEDKAAEIEDLEEVRRLVVLRERCGLGTREPFCLFYLLCSTAILSVPLSLYPHADVSTCSSLYTSV